MNTEKMMRLNEHISDQIGFQKVFNQNQKSNQKFPIKTINRVTVYKYTKHLNGT